MFEQVLTMLREISFLSLLGLKKVNWSVQMEAIKKLSKPNQKLYVSGNGTTQHCK